MPDPYGREAPALVLFDIDGTLLRRSGPHHREALAAAVRQVTGRDSTTDGIPVQGMLDGDIFRAMLQNAGLPESEIATHLPALMRHAQWFYARNCPPDLRHAVCPGVAMCLEALRRHRVLRALVTGNLARIGWKKMERAGLKRYFRYGAFADQGRTRAELAANAIRQARERGWISAHTPVSLIGDHPNDINAARANGIRSIAVATGVVPKDELAEHRPDLLLDDLNHLDVETVLS